MNPTPTRTILRDNLELLEAIEYMDSVMDQSKKDAFLILCLQAAFKDSLNDSTEELEFILADWLEEDHTQIGIYYNWGMEVASSLTTRQLTIASLLFEGNSQSEIAAYLNVDRGNISRQFVAIRKRISNKVDIDWSLI